jgi:hypothetical protein
MAVAIWRAGKMQAEYRLQTIHSLRKTGFYPECVIIAHDYRAIPNEIDHAGSFWKNR